MAEVVPHLQQFFDSLLRTIHEAIDGLSCEYEPNRADSFECQLGDFARTLSVMSSRLACRAGSERILDDLQELTNALNMHGESYHSRNVFYNMSHEGVEGKSPFDIPRPSMSTEICCGQGSHYTFAK